MKHAKYKRYLRMAERNRRNAGIRWTVYEPLEWLVDPTRAEIGDGPILFMEQEVDVEELRRMFPMPIVPPGVFEYLNALQKNAADLSSANFRAMAAPRCPGKPIA